MKRKVAVVLAGCGYKDGTEITEAVSVVIALSELEAEVSMFSPTAWLQESAKIARDKISPLSELAASSFDAVVFHGGLGAAKNLSSWASEGAQCLVDPDVRRVLESFYHEERPIAAICMAPTLIARVLGSKGITVTIGNDRVTASEIEKCGAIHEDCAVDDFVTDREHRVITTPAYMYRHATPAQVFAGIRGALRELVEMA